MQLVKIRPSLRSGSESTCGSLMPAVSSHYLIGIEMHLDCVFVCTALLVEIPPPLSRTLSHAVLLGEALFALICGQIIIYMAKKRKKERWHRADHSQLQEGNSCGSLQLIRALFNSWDLSCYSSFIFPDGKKNYSTFCTSTFLSVRISDLATPGLRSMTTFLQPHLHPCSTEHHEAGCDTWPGMKKPESHYQ